MMTPTTPIPADDLLADDSVLRLIVTDTPVWVTDGLCGQTDPEAFFPSIESPTAAAAKAVCRRCPVIDDCLQYALDTGIRYGVWGGMTDRERLTERMRRTRHAEPLAS